MNYAPDFPFKTMAMLAGLLTTLLVSRMPLKGGEVRPVDWI
jgi:hypothetical protein